MPKFVDDVHVAGGFSAYAADTATGAVVRAGVGQTDPIQTWEDSDGTVVAEIDIDGTVKVGGVPLGGGGGGFDFQGAWNPATAYTTGQLVRRLGDLHIALADSTGVDPATFVAGDMLGSADVGGMTPGVINQPNSTPFTVTETTTVWQLGLWLHSGHVFVGTLVGIASDWSDDTTVPWLGKATIAGAGDDEYHVVTLDTPVTLQSGTTYRIVDMGGKAAIVNPPTLSGVVATTGLLTYNESFNTTLGGYGAVFELLGEPAGSWDAVTRIADSLAAVPAGGATGQVLGKRGDNDGDLGWVAN